MERGICVGVELFVWTVGLFVWAGFLCEQGVYLCVQGDVTEHTDRPSMLLVHQSVSVLIFHCRYILQQV